jgi:putative tryptophan/tyrosine transport system substrate-binding protein
MIRRREFITLLGGAAAAWPLAARAQQRAKAHRIAVIHPSRPVAMLTDSGGLPNFEAFFKQLHQLGYVEGQNLLVERYSGEGRTESYAALARDVVGSKPELIFVLSARMVQHFQATATTIPIVAYTTDPVALGLAPSLARPGNNITGVVADVGVEFWNKQLEFLRETVPTISRVAYLTPRVVWDGPTGATIRKAAHHFGVDLLGALLESPIGELEYRRVFAAIVHDRANALIVNDTPENYANQRLITDLAMSTRLPAVYPNRSFVDAGGLIAYGPDALDLFRRAAVQVDQILKGAKPGEIPFYQATRFELIINLKTARALGLTVPLTLQAAAAEVIE